MNDVVKTLKARKKNEEKILLEKFKLYKQKYWSADLNPRLFLPADCQPPAFDIVISSDS